MGYKDNINKAIWGNPDDCKYITYDYTGLYSPYNNSWGISTSNQHVFKWLAYNNLMTKDVFSPELDESICPWGINKNSALGNTYVTACYQDGNNKIPVAVQCGVNRAKGQKPAFILYGDAYGDPQSVNSVYAYARPFSDNTGYLIERKKTATDFSPSDTWGYNFICNIRYDRLVIIPFIQAYKNINNYDAMSSVPFFSGSVNRYFNGIDTDTSKTFAELYPCIVSVNALIYYTAQNGDKFPAVNIATQTELSKEVINYDPLYDVTPNTMMMFNDSIYYKGEDYSGSSSIGKPHFLTIIGKNTSTRRYAWVYDTSGSLRPPYMSESSDYDKAVYNALDRHSTNNSYIFPDDLKNKLKYTVTGYYDKKYQVATYWYEGLSEDEIYRHIAYLGLPFYIPESNVTRGDFVNIDMTTTEFRQSCMYPDFDDNMITTGTYSSYQSSNSPLKNTQWLYDITTDYDPEYVQTDDDYEQKQKDRGSLSTTYHNNSQVNGYTAYILSGKGLNTIKNAINSQLKPPADVTADDWFKLDWYGQDPGSFILATNKFPCDVNVATMTDQIVTVGRTILYTSGDSPTALHAPGAIFQLDYLDFGTLEIAPYYNDFRDYAPYSNYIVHIPYFADYTLDPKIWLNHTCKIKIDYDIVTCNAMAEIWRDNMWYDTIYGTFGTPVPFLTYNAGGFQNAIVNAQAGLESSKNVMTQSFLSTATSIVGTGVGIATGNIPLAIGSGVGLINSASRSVDAYNRVQNVEYNLKHTAPNPTGTSGVGGVTALTTRNYCTLIISRPQPLHYNKAMYGKTIGFACCETGKLSNYHGLTVCSNTRFKSFAGTQSELAEIQQLLNNGVILP